MADEERDARLTQRYRELGSEEPSRELDASILAASRRAAETRPAPLVAPTGRRRWYFPLAAAAIITLAVAVTLQVDRQQPETGMEALSVDRGSPAPVPAPAEAAKPAPAPSAAAPAPTRKQRAERQAELARQLPQAAGRPDEFMFAPEPGPKPEPVPVPPAAPAPVPQSAPVPREDQARAAAEQTRAADRAEGLGANAVMAGPVAPVTAPAPVARAPAPAARASAPAEGRARAEVGAAAGLMSYITSPEQALQGIADLRRQGRHDEADKALAEFRKRFPDYRIAPEMLEKVERR